MAALLHLLSSEGSQCLLVAVGNSSNNFTTEIAGCLLVNASFFPPFSFSPLKKVGKWLCVATESFSLEPVVIKKKFPPEGRQ